MSWALTARQLEAFKLELAGMSIRRIATSQQARLHRIHRAMIQAQVACGFVLTEEQVSTLRITNKRWTMA